MFKFLSGYKTYLFSVLGGILSSGPVVDALAAGNPMGALLGAKGMLMFAGLGALRAGVANGIDALKVHLTDHVTKQVATSADNSLKSALVSGITQGLFGSSAGSKPDPTPAVSPK